MYQIKEVAKMAGVSTRTLHYYDEIGLLRPLKQDWNQYRVYNQQHIKKLQDIIFLKTLGFKLSDIRLILEQENYNRLSVLEKHRTNLKLQMEQLAQIIHLLDKTIDDEKGVYSMNDNERFEGFSMDDVEQHKKTYAKEAEEKYGHTDAYKESMAKTKHYSKSDWKRIHEEANSIYQSLVELMDYEPEHPLVQKEIMNWQNHISTNYYECTKEILAGLGETYVADPRFTKNIDRFKTGLAKFMSDAIAIYCSKQ